MTDNDLERRLNDLKEICNVRELPALPDIDPNEYLWWNPDATSKYLPHSNPNWRFYGYQLDNDHGFRLERLVGTNWFISDYGQELHWVHIASWSDWMRETYCKAHGKRFGELKVFHTPHYKERRLYQIPMPTMNFEYTIISFNHHLEYCEADKRILKTHKNNANESIDEVYNFALWIQSQFHFYQGKSDNYDEWVPDDMAVLIAHALLVMGDEDRARALSDIRTIYRGENDRVVYTEEDIVKWRTESAKFDFDASLNEWEAEQEQYRRDSNEEDDDEDDSILKLVSIDD